jgi:hypothetical protein
MCRITTIAFALIVAFVSFYAFGSAANAACRPPQLAQTGTVDCPVFTAPAATALPGTSMDGSTTILAGVPTMLFNGVVPPNGFLIQKFGTLCTVNDNGPAGAQTGISFGTGPLSTIFVTPPGYKPIGVVSIWCAQAGYVAARGW